MINSALYLDKSLYVSQLELCYIYRVDTDNNIIHDLLVIYLVGVRTFGGICVALTLQCHIEMME